MEKGVYHLRGPSPFMKLIKNTNKFFIKPGRTNL